MKTEVKMVAIIFSFLSLVFGCDSPSGHPGVSQDIKESKKRGVFISEYTVQPNPFKINDTLKIRVKEAWIERHWAYGQDQHETLLYPNEEYQICINTEERDIKGICLDWIIGIDFDKNIRVSSKNSLMGDFKTLPGDTIEYKVQKGTELSDNYEKNIIGKFVLINKK